MVNQRGVHIKQAARLNGEPLDAQGGGLCQHLVEHLIAVAQVVVEGQRHAVAQVAGLHGLPQAVNFLIHAYPPNQASASSTGARQGLSSSSCQHLLPRHPANAAFSMTAMTSRA